MTRNQYNSILFLILAVLMVVVADGTSGIMQVVGSVFIFFCYIVHMVYDHWARKEFKKE